MSKLQLSSRFTASTLLFSSAVIPVGIWILLADAAPPGHRFEFLLSSLSTGDSELFFIVLAGAALFSLFAGALVAFVERRAAIRAVLVGDVIQAAAYAAVGLWPMSVVSAFPLWWLYRAQRET